MVSQFFFTFSILELNEIKRNMSIINKLVIFNILMSFYPPKVELKEEIGCYNTNEIFFDD